MSVSRDACRKFVLHLRHHYPEKMSQLTTALWKHYEDVRETEAVKVAKLQVVDTIQKIICKPPSRLFPIGSLVTGLGTNSSDIDLCLLNPSAPLSDQLTKNEALLCAKTALSEAHGEGTIEIDKLLFFKGQGSYNVPILTFNTAGFSVDIQENREHAIRCSHLLYHYAKLDLRFVALSVLIKNWAKSAGISGARNGLFGSYALSLLVLHYLQVAVDPPILPNLQQLYKDKFSDQIPVIDLWNNADHIVLPADWRKNEQSLGELMAGFFAYYCWDVQLAKDVVCISEATIKQKHESILHPGKKRSPVWMEDFFGNQNVSRSVTKKGLSKFRSVVNSVVDGLQNDGPTDIWTNKLLFPDPHTTKAKNAKTSKRKK